MEVLSTLILGFIQGVAEFLPISSSAHLIIFREVFGIGRDMGTDVAFVFDIALHLGTLLAIGIFFFKDFINMFHKGFTKGVKDPEGKILWYLIAASVPAAIIGILFDQIIEDYVRNKFLLIAISLMVMGIIIYLVDKYSKREKTIKEVTLKDAFIIGCSQVFALIPGFSRSGTTIATARVLKLEREDAAKFSFFLSAPVVLGAVVLQLFKSSTWDIIMNNTMIFVLGTLMSFVIGMLCIRFLLKYLRKNDFKIFMIYRVILGIIVIAWLLIK